MKFPPVSDAQRVQASTVVPLLSLVLFVHDVDLCCVGRFSRLSPGSVLQGSYSYVYEESGIAKCPFSPEQNTTTVYAGKTFSPLPIFKTITGFGPKSLPRGLGQKVPHRVGMRSRILVSFAQGLEFLW